jgi:hypothetical protein
MNKIEKFIKENNLDFTGSGSDLNSNCCVISGYALYLELSFNELRGQMEGMASENWDELRRVFDYAEGANYGEFWTKEEAKSQYVF